ncbi:cysteine-rich receptor-like protein kinase 28 [Lolium perenne]|uniref:cysteine-rich receptor-like protein kinase 28 n=1 Tax=Lolium perenne TaxID=4522 RepID=UPI0021F59AA7|nr:cysteine-rich receptor-like protein kinase 28 [Lolium perenne]
MERRFVPLESKRYGRFYVKTDVYSYGVLLLELITQQMYIKSSSSCKSLATWVLQHALENNYMKCIPPQFAKGPRINDIKRCICIALRCVAEDPAERPTMGDVDRWLRNKNQVAPWINKLDHNTKDTVTEGGMDTPATTTPMPTDPEGSTGPRLRGGERTTGPTNSMIEPNTVQGGNTARKSKKGAVRKSSKHQVSSGSV